MGRKSAGSGRTWRGKSVLAVGAAFVLVFAVIALVGAGGAEAAPAAVGLGTADSFAVLGGSTVTNTGPSVISGDLGVSPGTAVTGFPPGTVTNGTIHAADAVAAQAQADTTIAYDDAAGRSPTATITADLGGQTLVPGVYRGSSLGLTGTLTLDAQGDQGAVFIFQAASTLITASGSRVALINGAQACNVFWQVGSSATLGTNSVFVGTILALTSVTADTGTSAAGRLLARNGAITLDSNTVTRSTCAAAASPTPTATPSGTPTATPSATPTATPSASTTPSGAASSSSPTASATKKSPAPPAQATAAPTAISGPVVGATSNAPTAALGGDSGGAGGGAGATAVTGAGAGSGTSGGAGSGGATGSLPFTGALAPTQPLVGAGLAALGSGVVLLFLARRRTNE